MLTLLFLILLLHKKTRARMLPIPRKDAGYLAFFLMDEALLLGIGYLWGAL